MSTLHAYLFFDGTCAEAMRFYERTLGGRIQALMTHAESPVGAQASPDNAGRILHGALLLGDGSLLMASDAMAGQPEGAMQGCSLSLSYATADEARRVFDALADGGTVHMPMEKTFWSEAFGMLVDRYGIRWMVGVTGNEKPAG